MGNCQNISKSDQKNAVVKIKEKTHLIIKCLTWEKDSYGLFDYECKSLIGKSLKTTAAGGRIIRSGDEIQLKKDVPHKGHIKKAETKYADDEELINLHYKEGVFWISTAVEHIIKRDHKILAEEGLWMVVRSAKPNSNEAKGYKLSEGELLKLGRIRFRIKELKTPEDPESRNKKRVLSKEKFDDLPLQNPDERRNSQASSLNSIGQKINTIACKICLAEGNDPVLGALISPCNCSGTMRYVHLKCLQRWLQSRLHSKQSGNAIAYQWKPFDCELCKQRYPQQFEIDNKKYDLIEIPKPEAASYIVIEVLNKDSQQPKGIYVLNMDTKTTIGLGRGHDSDIRISDISVSRYHAVIRLEKGNFYIEDNNSKFGTLVNINKTVPIADEYNNMSIQVGRTVLNLSVKKHVKGASSCFSPSRVQTEADEVSEAEIRGRIEEDEGEGEESLDEHPESPQQQAQELQANVLNII